MRHVFALSLTLGERQLSLSLLRDTSGMSWLQLSYGPLPAPAVGVPLGAPIPARAN